MQILMRGTICWTEYSCGYRAGCPHSGPPESCVFSCPHYSDTLTKSNKAKNKEERAKSVSGKKFTPNFMTPAKSKSKEKWKMSFQCASNSRHRRADVKSLKESSVKASKHLNLISGSVSSCLERLTVGPSTLCTYCEYLTWYSPNR